MIRRGMGDRKHSRPLRSSPRTKVPPLRFFVIAHAPAPCYTVAMNSKGGVRRGRIS